MSGKRPCLLFDLDGTLVHTDPVHLKAFNRMLAPFGRQVDLAYYVEHIMGRQNAAIMRDVFPDLPESEHRRLADEKEANFRAMADELEPLPGLLELLARAADQDVETCVVTNAPRANASMMLQALGLEGRFDVLVIGDEIEHAKPHPLPYLTGLARLDGDAARSLAFEDSRSGIRAAGAAGLPVIGMATSLDRAALLAAGAVLAAADYTDGAARSLISERTGLRF
ncbi:haloacid dehalogenase [Alsobacter soli]|uniref:Haloacid dehalogenase n=1 Tax=Alsobacter soli TaxID=2109933 RepID=A0A2T1HSZ3_9HYPH|nr:HAD-IA family hydrolase [Alsobacter soli]PSC04783.1 haloacid dehalogenase [Alsobacter soli]